MGLKCSLGLLLAQGRVVGTEHTTGISETSQGNEGRREATFTHKATNKQTDFKNKTTKSVLPHIQLDADYCHRNEFGIYVIKDENLRDPCKHRHLF